MSHKYYQGMYRPKFPKKYTGDANNIVYRSFLEFKFMRYLDTQENVLEWSSEETIIKYVSPIDGRVHRYFPDFHVKLKTKDGIVSALVEIKPESQTKPPKVRTKPTRGYINEVVEWGKNSAKWDAARNYCEDRGLKFILMTEKHLGVTYK
jgi:hypothetical protein